jgi:putative endonuclease
MPDPRHQLGLRAEHAAAGWLTRRGWRVLDRRWRSASGEIDLVCLDDLGTLVGVEVKVRRTGRAGNPLDAVDRRRLSRLRAALVDYARQTHLGAAGLRIDIIAVTPEAARWRLKWLPGADAW